MKNAENPDRRDEEISSEVATDAPHSVANGDNSGELTEFWFGDVPPPPGLHPIRILIRKQKG